MQNSEGHPFVFKGKRYIAYEVKGHGSAMIEEDCTCRHCCPDKWFLDTDRGVWIKKIEIV